MPNIIEYKVIQAKGIDAFQEAIDNAVKEGWQPYGELHTDRFLVAVFTQVVVKYK